MLTSKQRATLRALGHPMAPILHIGKEGITPTVVQQAWDALEARELIKVALQRFAPFDKTAEAATALATETHAEIAQCIGSKFLLYRMARKPPHLLED